MDSVSVKIRYMPVMDSLCAFASGYDIESEWEKELLIRKTELEQEWEKTGQKLISAAEEITGSNFEKKQYVAYLTLCNTPSRSSPLILNMRHSLSSFSENPVPMRYKRDTLFHELMHPYIDELLPKFAPTLEAYKNEHARVLDHLHLLALQKAVYLHLNLEQELSSIIEIDSSLPGGYYKRAWEIVNSHETFYQVLVEELVRPE